MIRNIALRGLIGRKGDTILLWSVIALSFIFLVLSTTLITSLEATDSAQRIATYGSWQVMAAGVSDEDAQLLAQNAEQSVILPMIRVSSGGLGADNGFFVSTYTPALDELGQFELKEGRWPENRNEIVMEYARMSAEGYKVGDTVKLICELEVTASADYQKQQEEIYNLALEANKNEIRENTMGMLRSGFVLQSENGILLKEKFYSLPSCNAWDSKEARLSFFLYWVANCETYAPVFADDDHPDGQVLYLQDMTEEQLETALELFFNEREIQRKIEPEVAKNIDLLGNKELSMRLDGYNLTLTLMYDYTICGMIETYSDHWDSGRTDLPQAFVLPEHHELLLSGMEQVTEKYSFYTPAAFENLLLLSAGEGASAYELWEDLLPDYNRALLHTNDFTAPIWRYAGTVHTDKTGYNITITDALTQIRFDFSVADSDYSDIATADPISAWLVPADWDESAAPYLYDAPIETVREEFIRSIVGSLSDIAGDGETFELKQRARHGVYSSGDLTLNRANSTVVFDYDGQRHEIPLADFLAANFTVNGKIPVTGATIYRTGEEEPTDFDALRVNRFAYPSSAEGTGSLLSLVIGILFVTTVCAVFQIFFSQIRRRLRRIVLLKSVGAESNQITKMLLWEFLFFLVTALPIGSLAGLGGARIAIDALSRAQNRPVLLTIDRNILLFALLMGAAALLIGMAVPMVMAIGVPITGRTARKKPLSPPKKDIRQNFLNVSIRGLFANHARTVGSFALCAFMMLIGTLCLFLGFRMMGEYRDTVVRDGVPDYRLRSPYAMSARQRGEYLAELEALGVTESIDTYFVGEDVTILRESFNGSKLLTAVTKEDESGFKADFWGLTSEDELYARLTACATVGSLNSEAFDAGREVMVLIPLYREGGAVSEGELERAEGWERVAASGIHTSYYAEYDGIYARDTAVQVGDTLSLSTVTTSISGTAYVTKENSASTTVGAILYYFPDTGIWPFAGDSEGYQVICSPKLIKAVLPYAISTKGTDMARAISNSNGLFYTNEYGRTDFFVNGRSDLPTEEVDTALLVFARAHSMEFEVYHESCEKLLRDAVNNILLCCLLGLTAVLLALVIFGNTISSEIEQERGKIGILQSLGVSNGKLILRQLGIGLAASLFALILSNLALWGGIAIFAALTGKVVANLLWRYPIMGHIGICAGISLVIIILYVLPMMRLRKYLPIENIKTGR